MSFSVTYRMFIVIYFSLIHIACVHLPMKPVHRPETRAEGANPGIILKFGETFGDNPNVRTYYVVAMDPLEFDNGMGNSLTPEFVAESIQYNSTQCELTFQVVINRPVSKTSSADLVALLKVFTENARGNKPMHLFVRFRPEK